MSHSSFLILDEDAWEATVLPNTLGSTVASQQIILIKKNVSLSSLLHASSFLNLKKTALSLLSHFVLIPQPQRRCRQERERRWREREREKSLWKKEKK
jgi:hypothetical protein